MRFVAPPADPLSPRRRTLRSAFVRTAHCALVSGALALNALVAPVMLWTCLLVALWAALMTKEFFAGAWLRVHVTAYLLSHMAIMPMIDGYTTGLDWLEAGTSPRPGLRCSGRARA